MIFEKLKTKIFPCSEKIASAIEENSKSTKRLIEACKIHKAEFPPLKEGHIVNPR